MAGYDRWDRPRAHGDLTGRIGAKLAAEHTANVMRQVQMRHQETEQAMEDAMEPVPAIREAYVPYDESEVVDYYHNYNGIPQNN